MSIPGISGEFVIFNGEFVIFSGEIVIKLAAKTCTLAAKSLSLFKLISKTIFFNFICLFAFFLKERLNEPDEHSFFASFHKTINADHSPALPHWSTQLEHQVQSRVRASPTHLTSHMASFLQCHGIQTRLM